MTKLSENIIRMHGEGISYREIKKELGCSLGTISYHLGDGQKTKTRARSKALTSSARTFIQEQKQGKKCADCKEDYPYWILEFDHLGDKSFQISDFRHHTYDLKVIKAEIDKCEIVCSNCHKNRTYLRRLKGGEYTLDLSDYYE